MNSPTPHSYVPELVEYLNLEFGDGDDSSSLFALKPRHLKFMGTFIQGGTRVHYWKYPGIITMWLPSFCWGNRYVTVEESEDSIAFSMACDLPQNESAAS